MAGQVHSGEISENVIEFDNLQALVSPAESAERNDPLFNANSMGEECKTEEEKALLDTYEEDNQFGKILNVREVHETSPFKQAVKGFVLNKLSKKVGSSHILSGLTEKIVKKLEENKDINIQSGLVHGSESDLNLASLRKDPSVEVISTSISCELKSVVANDLVVSEALNVEDAVECLEEFKLPVNNTTNGVNIPLKPEHRSNSISLPSSPAHRFEKRASSVCGSLENATVIVRNVNSHEILLQKEKNISERPELEKPSLQDEIELQENKKETLETKKCINSEKRYLSNEYVSIKHGNKKFKYMVLKRFFICLSILKNILSSLSLSHFFLLASVIIHNINLISSYFAFMFDGLVIGYVCYSYICILVQKPVQNISSSFPFVDTHLENASLYIQETKTALKGSVKVLKGEYDPEMVKNHPNDLVEISIENCCLKIFLPKKKNNKDSSLKVESFNSYDLLGATISIVPRGLSKKRIWNKKYPICIALPLSSKISISECYKDASKPTDPCTTDYLSAVHCDENEAELTNQKALYLFALTDREKESLFWILQKSTTVTEDKAKCNEQPCDTSKIDFSCMSYTSLLELNSDESLSPIKDTFEDDNVSLIDKKNHALDFDIYMRGLFENFERMNRLTSRSKSLEDLSNLMEDSSKPTESFLSKDDSFVSSSTSEYSVDWMNIALGRIFYDVLTQKYWSDNIKARIQKKLDKIEMPAFIESLEVSDVFLGTSLPQIHTVSNPVADNNGLWLNFDFNYCGSFQMTLKTKLKMAKAKQLPGIENVELSESRNVIIPSSESSDDDANDSRITSAKNKKFINRIEKWITHKHFQTVAQSRFVKKYVGDLSNMPLTLTVELNTLHGMLTINIPPAPTDRIWYGFRKDPVLSLTAYPKVGTHEINLSAIVQMIEKKLVQEFKKALVMPNMDDLLIPVMFTPIYDI